MEVAVLGTLEVPGVRVPTAGKPRQVLGLLALRAGRAVGAGVLARELWGGRVPASGRAGVHTYVRQVRAVLGRRAVLSRGGGYVLDRDVVETDVSRFADLAGRGRLAVASGDPVAGAGLLRRALGLWRGEALAGVPRGEVLDGEVLAVQRSREEALLAVLDCELAAGRAERAVADLAEAVVRAPVDERFHSRYMVALYRLGRTGQAVEAYRGLTATLRRELGVGPSRRVREVYQAILRADPLPLSA